MPIEMTVSIVPVGVVEVIVPQGGVDHIHPYAVGKLDGCSPIVLLHQLFGALVLATQQPVGRFGGGTHHHFGSVHGHTREHREAMAPLAVGIATGVDEILAASYRRPTQCLHAVGIVETGINHGNGHTLSAEAGFV